ncbi:MAG: heparan-alpha-glucosaminide N-acetyltransferase domain-containing protein [Planctomycetales bacterium]
MSTVKPTPRIASMDQFRGYTVVGMFLVNFFGWYALTHQVFRHNSTHFSYADSIMPSFILCAGFSFRLTALKRFPELGTARAAWSYIQRSLTLILISLLLDTPDPKFKTWSQVTPGGISEYLFALGKAGLWEVLAIIGVCQILLLPVILRGTIFRLSAVVLLEIAHIVVTYAFNYNFQLGRENWFNQFWGAPKQTVFDGGLFGLLPWSAVMLAGTLVYDLLAALSPKRAWFPLLVCGVLLMGNGYLLSCGTRLYDRAPGEWDKLVQTAAAKTTEEQKKSGKPPAPDEHAPDPVWPQVERWKSPGLGWAEPPFMPPPAAEFRAKNFWMMNMRLMSPAFTIFSIGFALGLYAVFIVACDLSGLQVGVFRTFGQNPLAAYIAHQAVKYSVRLFSPKDSPLWWALISFAIFFYLTWFLIRSMEKQKLYLRL